jgi:hypothetical protein
MQSSPPFRNLIGAGYGLQFGTCEVLELSRRSANPGSTSPSGPSRPGMPLSIFGYSVPAEPTP